jgi:hypothetical protein
MIAVDKDVMKSIRNCEDKASVILLTGLKTTFPNILCMLRSRWKPLDLYLLGSFLPLPWQLT